MTCGKIIYGNKLIIKEKTICYTSEKGHNNFKVPYKILKSCLFPIDITEDTTKNTSPPTKNNYTIVWIEKNV